MNAPATHTARLVVNAAGPGVSVQDSGRHGYLRFGVTGAGPMDPLAHAVANRAVGNPLDAAALEISLGGLDLTGAGSPVDVALAGGNFTIRLNDQALPAATRLTLNPDDRLQVKAGPAGCWCYLAVAGSLDLPKALGSLATHTRSGLGGVTGRNLAAGDTLGVLNPRAGHEGTGRILAPFLERPGEVVRVLLGPQDDYFAADQIEAFLNGPWTLTARGDRMAAFLDGPRIGHARGYDIVSDGIAMGAVQVPGNGLPMVLMADRQPTGGYPKIANIIGPDLGRLAQIRAGTPFRFAAVSWDEAVAARRTEAEELARLGVEPLVRQVFTSEFLLGLNLISGVGEID